MVAPASQQRKRKLLAEVVWTATNALTSLQVSIRLENAKTGASYPGFSQQTITTNVTGSAHQVTIPQGMEEVRVSAAQQLQVKFLQTIHQQSHSYV
jgi:hypothetical protein